MPLGPLGLSSPLPALLPRSSSSLRDEALLLELEPTGSESSDADDFDESDELDDESLLELSLELELELRLDDVQGRRFWYGKGCDACNNTGYRGRMGIYEIMTLDDDMRDMIVKHASTQVIRAEARKRGMRTLRACGLMAIYDGVTTIEEVVRETLSEEG